MRRKSHVAKIMMNPQEKPKIVVVGSINMDLVIRCAHLPQPGETILARTSQEVPGGKGANQAVSAARCGATVSMVGRVGNDAFAQRLVTNLKQEGIDGRHISTCSDRASGLAVVAVDDQGENSILVVPGANAAVSCDDVRAAKELIQGSDVLLVQLEIPYPAVVESLAIAREAGVRTVLDPAPAPNKGPAAELLDCDLICPNIHEAEAILERKLRSSDDYVQAARDLVQLGCRQSIVTLGSQGAVVCCDDKVEIVSGFPVEAIDTTAAGDAFAGAVSVAWAEGYPLWEAVRRANAAGAIAASRLGAQVAMPRRKEIDALVADNQGAI